MHGWIFDLCHDSGRGKCGSIPCDHLLQVNSSLIFAFLSRHVRGSRLLPFVLLAFPTTLTFGLFCLLFSHLCWTRPLRRFFFHYLTLLFLEFGLSLHLGKFSSLLSPYFLFLPHLLSLIHLVSCFGMC